MDTLGLGYEGTEDDRIRSIKNVEKPHTREEIIPVMKESVKDDPNLGSMVKSLVSLFLSPTPVDTHSVTNGSHPSSQTS